MKWIDLTLPSPEENLAFDEALLDICEEGQEGEVLRFWEPTDYFVVLGYSNRWRTEVDATTCAELGIPVLRRCSGGGTVLQGPGCLNYSLVLKIEGERTLGSITETNRTVMNANAEALEKVLGERPMVRGYTDLALGPLKFSGNAQRRKRGFALVHGTFLLDFDLRMIEKCLPMPSAQPDYRQNRRHTDFLTNLKVPAAEIKKAFRARWEAGGTVDAPPLERTRAMATSVYSTDDWRLKF